MSWYGIPNFDDPNAKANEKIGKYGIRHIEVLYGGSNGNNGDDGHGHMVAIELEGVYQQIYHRYPGQSRSKPEMNAREFEDVEEKIELSRKAAALQYSTDWERTAREMADLQKRWKGVFDWGSPVEKQCYHAFRAAVDYFYTRRNEVNASAKKKIISEAQRR